MEHFTLLKLPINEVFNTIKNQPWVRRRDQSNTTGSEEYFPITTAKGTKPSIVGPSEDIWRISSSRTYSKNISSLQKQSSANRTFNPPESNIDLPMQDDRLSKLQVHRACYLPFLILCTLFLNKILFYAPNHHNISIHCSTLIHYNSSIHTPR